MHRPGKFCDVRLKLFYKDPSKMPETGMVGTVGAVDLRKENCWRRMEGD